MRTIEEYEKLIALAVIPSEWARLVSEQGLRLLKMRSKYEGFGVPWMVLAVIHMREADNDFSRQLLNGQSWARKTTIVPKGKGPWKSFQDSMADAIKEHDLTSLNKMTSAEILQFIEEWNGWGYFKKGKQSPYVWTGTNHGISVGEYIADGTYDPKAIDHNLGAGTMFLVLADQLDVPGHLPTGTGAIPPSGTIKLEPATSVLGAAYPLRYGSQGEFVKELQQFLNEKHGQNLKLDGDLGFKTARAFFRVFGVRLIGDTNA